MTTRDMVVQCEQGLQLRVASTVAGVARDHRATSVKVSCGECQKANACSILELLSLEAHRGTRLEVVVEGPDEAIVLKSLTEIFEHGGGI
ncbi:MAG: HPr family phosphocarrier protein [Kiritimatiellia bacterium]